MSLSIGIVGLPNVGKSTLFKALTKKQVPAENFPFCTIDPNVGVVCVPDERVDKLAEMSKSKKVVHTAIEFVDIAGLVAGAHKGEGLGNKFLSNIRNVDAICQVVRVFEDDQIIHVSGRVNPEDDVKIINLELVLADLEVASKRVEALKKETKSGVNKELEKKMKVYTKIFEHLSAEKLLASLPLDDDELILIKESNFLTIKPMLYVLNIAEKDVHRDIQIPGLSAENIIKMCVQVEAELVDLPQNEVKEYLDTLGVPLTGLENLIVAGYKILDLISYLTTGEDETRSWTVRRGSSAPHAAGKIHSDFEKGFIVAETVNWKDLLDMGSWPKAREKGLIRTEGKSYIVQDGDVMVFRFQK